MSDIKPGGVWCDVCVLPDGRLAKVYNVAGEVVCEIDGGGGWSQQLPLAMGGFAIFLRCGIDIDGEVKVLAKGSDDHAYRIRRQGTKLLGKTSGDFPVAIDTANGDEYVMLETRNASGQIIPGVKYARNGEEFPTPFPGGSSQGIRDVVNGEVRWGDPWFYRDVGGVRLAQPVQRGHVIAGQIDKSDHILVWNGQQLLLAIGDGGHCYEPHLAEWNGRYVISARCDSGSAFSVSPWPAFTVTPQPEPVPVPPPVPEPPKMYEPIPSQLETVREVWNRCTPEQRATHAFVAEAVAWALRQKGLDFYVNQKRGTQGDSEDAISTPHPQGAGGWAIIDIIAFFGSTNHWEVPAPTWNDVTQKTIDGGTVGGGRLPRNVLGGATQPPTQPPQPPHVCPPCPLPHDGVQINSDYNGPNGLLPTLDKANTAFRQGSGRDMYPELIAHLCSRFIIRMDTPERIIEEARLRGSGQWAENW